MAVRGNGRDRVVQAVEERLAASLVAVGPRGGPRCSGGTAVILRPGASNALVLGRDVPVVGQLVAGRRLVQGCASSRVRDTCSRRFSCQGAATIWTPTGRPVA